MLDFGTFLLEKLYIPPTNLGIERHNMPQITSKFVPDFLKFLKKNYGITSKKTKMFLKDLKMTQRDINAEKVLGMTISASVAALAKPAIVTKDGYVMDGHHRIVALLNKDKNYKMAVYHVNTDINDLLDKAKLYPKTFYKDITESK